MHFIILFFPLLLIACGSLSDELSDNEQELNYNYQLLKAYFYHPERIKEYSKYEKMREVDSMYSDLKDYFNGVRYTRYYKPDTSEEVIENIENSEKYYSFGFERILKDDALIVTAVYPISPAASAGLRKYDTLLFANNVSLIGENAAGYLNSDSLFENPTVFKVLRGTDILLLPSMQKQEISRPTVYLDSLNGIPFITVTEFTVRTNNPEGTYAEFKEYLKEINGAKTAIVDVRNNPGGNINHCTAMAAELAPFNSELVYDIMHTRRNGKNVIDTTHYFVKDFLKSEGAGVNIKWIILMNGWSASCSERFAAAVKYSRPETALIGQRSYGKGIGQIYTKTYLGGLAYITAIQSYYPSGETFHEVGVVPNIPTENNNNAVYIAAIEAAQHFSLAKRLPAPVQLRALPPSYKSREIDLGMYKEIPISSTEIIAHP